MQEQKASSINNLGLTALMENRFAKLAPIGEALHFLMRMVLSRLPEKARILCVGVGTGPELFALADAFPHWTFVAVDPAEPLLGICRKRAEERGISSRCTFHKGYLDSLPESGLFDAATAILVSQFVVKQEERRDFFRQIARRLLPDGYLVSADLASTMSGLPYNSLLETWLRAMNYAGIPSEEVDKMLSGWGKDISVLPPQEIGSIIALSGFEAPVLFHQALFIHAWYAQLRAQK